MKEIIKKIQKIKKNKGLDFLIFWIILIISFILN